MLRLRCALREYFPAAVTAFDDLTAPDALELLAAAQDPAAARLLSEPTRLYLISSVINQSVQCGGGEVSDDQLDLTFAALADPTRRSILTQLAHRDATVNELAQHFPISLPGISRHLKVLERAGLIARTRDAQWRPSRLQTQPLDEAAAWMQARTRVWQARMDRLEAHLHDHGEHHD